MRGLLATIGGALGAVLGVVVSVLVGYALFSGDESGAIGWLFFGVPVGAIVGAAGGIGFVLHSWEKREASAQEAFASVGESPQDQTLAEHDSCP